MKYCDYTSINQPWHRMPPGQMQMIWVGEEQRASESPMHLGFYFHPCDIFAYLSEYLSNGEMIQLQKSLKWSSLSH
jgi:hypothetical protein